MTMTSRVSTLLSLGVFIALSGCDLENSGSGGGGAPGEAFSVAVALFPLAFVSMPFDEEAVISGGTPPYTIVEVTDAAAWATFSMSADGERLRITGTPDTEEVDDYSIELMDGDGHPGTATSEIDVRANGSISLSGAWDMTWTPDEVTGEECAGEENDPPVTETVQVGQTGNDVTISGINEVAGNTISGKLYGGTSSLAMLIMDGELPEVGGTTQIHYHLFVQSPTTMAGEEQWSWILGNSWCEGTTDLDLVKQ